MNILKWILIGGGVLVGLFLLDRLMLHFEKRGWIYWRKSKPSGASMGNAILELQSILEPSKKHVLEERREEKTENEDEGDPPET